MCFYDRSQSQGYKDQFFATLQQPSLIFLHDKPEIQFYSFFYQIQMPKSLSPWKWQVTL